MCKCSPWVSCRSSRKSLCSRKPRTRRLRTSWQPTTWGNRPTSGNQHRRNRVVKRGTLLSPIMPVWWVIYIKYWNDSYRSKSLETVVRDFWTGLHPHFLCTKIWTRPCKITGNLQHHRLVGKEQGPAERHRRRPVQKGIEQTVGGDLRRPSGSVRWRSRRRRQR